MPVTTGTGPRPNQGTRNPFQVFHLKGRSSVIGAVICCPPGSALVGSWNWELGLGVEHFAMSDAGVLYNGPHASLTLQQLFFTLTNSIFCDSFHKLICCLSGLKFQGHYYCHSFGYIFNLSHSLCLLIFAWQNLNPNSIKYQAWDQVRGTTYPLCNKVCQFPLFSF